MRKTIEKNVLQGGFDFLYNLSVEIRVLKALFFVSRCVICFNNSECSLSKSFGERYKRCNENSSLPRTSQLTICKTMVFHALLNDCLLGMVSNNFFLVRVLLERIKIYNRHRAYVLQLSRRWLTIHVQKH